MTWPSCLAPPNLGFLIYRVDACLYQLRALSRMIEYVITRSVNTNCCYWYSTQVSPLPAGESPNSIPSIITVHDLMGNVENLIDTWAVPTARSLPPTTYISASCVTSTSQAGPWREQTQTHPRGGKTGQDTSLMGPWEPVLCESLSSRCVCRLWFSGLCPFAVGFVIHWGHGSYVSFDGGDSVKLEGIQQASSQPLSESCLIFAA